MKKVVRIFLIISSVILITWLLLTIRAENTCKEKSFQIGLNGKQGKALIVFDPDLFYNFDE